MPLTDSDLTRALNDERHGGYGFRSALAEGALAHDAAVYVACRALVIQFANERGWTPEQLFTWADSKLGRWFGEAYFHGPVSPGISQRDIDSTFRQPS